MLGKRQKKVKDRSAQEHGQTTKSQALLREIDDIVDFSFFSEKVAPFFSPIGRKSIDPEVMLKMMLLGYMFQLHSDPEIVDECIDRRSFREFLGYEGTEKIPVHTNFGNWRKRIGPDAFEEAISDILSQCEANGMRLGNARLFDSSRVQARATASSSPAKVEIELHENPDDYLKAFEWQTEYEDPKDDPRYGDKLVINTNDPEARLIRYGNEPSRFVHKVHWETDSKTGLVVQSTVSFKPEHEVMLDFLEGEKRKVISATADTAYDEVECYRELEQMGIKAYIPFLDHANDKGDKYHLKDFAYNANEDTYTCPGGKTLCRYVRQEAKRRTGYRAESTDCASCPMRDKCIDKDTKRRTLTVSDDRPYIEKIKLSNLMPAHKRMMRRRKTVMEGAFAHAKTWCGMRFARGMGRASMRIQAALTAIVINIKKLVAHIRAAAKNGQASESGHAEAGSSTQMRQQCPKTGILTHLAHPIRILAHFEAVLICQGAY